MLWRVKLIIASLYATTEKELHCLDWICNPRFFPAFQMLSQQGTKLLYKTFFVTLIIEHEHTIIVFFFYFLNQQIQ